MKSKNVLLLSLSLVLSSGVLVSCVNEDEKILDIIETSLELYEGENYTLDVETFNLSGDLVFSSSDENVAKVDNKGKITALKEGETYIKVSNGELTDSLHLVVKKDVELETFNISITKDSLSVGESTLIEVDIIPNEYLENVTYEIKEGKDLIEIKDRKITALKSGEVSLVAKCGAQYSNEVTLTIYDFTAQVFNKELAPGRSFVIRTSLEDNEINSDTVDEVEIQDPSICKYTGAQYGTLYFEALKGGKTTLVIKLKDGRKSNKVEVIVESENNYDDITKEEFYANYTRATDPFDAKTRTRHHLMSGDISTQDQEPTIEEERPIRNGEFIKHSPNSYAVAALFHTVVDSEGYAAFDVYKDGAYVTLEEVAAYIFAFGDVPPNYYEDRYNYPEPYESPWGEYLRLNNSPFSGDTSDYPYEPELPRISGNGGDLVYYEVDIGTTGTDCDPNYETREYNDGNSIVRGAARIVYSARYTNGKPITDPDDRYVFYTYNHYNDFQEYLNYENGWGEMFGNVSAGNELNEHDRHNPPTEYPEVVADSLTGF